MAIKRFKRLRQSLETLFPERHIYIRSGGEMRGYVFSTNKQLLGATGVAVTALWMGVCTAAMAVNALAVSSTDQQVIVERVFEFIFRELTAANMYTRQIRFLCAALRFERRQEALLDQLSDADLEADVIQEVIRLADQTVLEPVRRRSQPDNSQVRIDHQRIGQKLPIHSFAVERNQMSFIDDDQLEPAQLSRSSIDGLDARHDYWLLSVPAAKSCRVQTDLDIRADCLQR